MEEPDTPAMTFETYANQIPEHPTTIRHGQWAFTLLRENDPGLAEWIRTTDLDPFYWPDSEYLTSQKWQNLMGFLAHNWKGSIS